MSGLPPPARAPRGAAPPNLHPSQQPHSPRRSYRSSGPGRPAVSSSAPSRWGAEETPQAHQPYRAASGDPGPHRTPERARGGGLRDGLQLLAAHEPLFTPTLQAPRGRPGCGNARARAEAHRAPSVTPRACTDSPSPAPVSHAPRAVSRAVDTPGAHRTADSSHGRHPARVFSEPAEVAHFHTFRSPRKWGVCVSSRCNGPWEM